MGQCQSCGVVAEVHQAAYQQNTGMLVARQHRTYEGQMCRTCSSVYFRKATLHNLFFGWWGTISFLLTPIFIINNIVYWAKSRSLAAPSERALAAPQG